MVLAYVFINVAKGKDKEAYCALEPLDGMLETTPVKGDHDIVAKIETDTISNVGPYVLDKIRKIPSVVHTTTYIVPEL